MEISSEQKIITTYLNYSLPLCCILNNTNNYSWIYEHFTNIYLMYDKDGNIWLDYLENVTFYDKVLDYRFISADESRKIKDIRKFINEQINEGHYLMFFVDMFFLSTGAHSKEAKHITQLFIFDHLPQKNVYVGFGFDENDQFSRIEYNCDEVINGYVDCLKNVREFENWVDTFNIISLKSKNSSLYKCNYKKVLNDIEIYLNSYGNLKMLRPEVILERGVKAYYGIEAQDKLIDGFSDLYNNKFVLDYRFIHLIVEHKHLLYKKLCFISYLMGIDEKVKKILTDFNLVYKQFENIRYIYMMNVLKDSPRNSIYDQLLNKRIINDLQIKLKKASLNEKRLLKDFLHVAKQVL